MNGIGRKFLYWDWTGKIIFTPHALTGSARKIIGQMELPSRPRRSPIWNEDNLNLTLIVAVDSFTPLRCVWFFTFNNERLRLTERTASSTDHRRPKTHYRSKSQYFFHGQTRGAPISFPFSSWSFLWGPFGWFVAPLLYLQCKVRLPETTGHANYHLKLLCLTSILSYWKSIQK